ncbi:MAG: carbohydrate binding family 9 domain-containing protein [Acidimicrobiia bacterium]|nr:carbohydrate binding family 9 domain-containing protein [Acidimicrobiia bacterium]
MRAAVLALCGVLLAWPAQAQPTLRAVRLAAPLEIDGRLDEAFYGTTPSISDFVQIEPVEGMPATEKTELWIGFDAANVYVTFRNWESRPDLVVAKEMRRDNTTIYTGDDNVTFFFDTFYDRRNGVEFTVNAIGGRIDGQTFNDRQWSGDWNTIWDVEVGRFEGGWTVEAAIPFKSLRYRPGDAQTWGFNAFRTNRWKNELSYLTPVAKARGQGGVHQASVAAQLVGISAPSGSKNLEIKPYLISTASTHAAPAGTSRDLSGDVGLDVKYGVTQNLTADLTYNTDFAQVEADQQQVNLTRFSLFFPEKREFFLENAGTFQFGGAQVNNFGGGADTPILFYSRRIGLENGRAVPIDAGGRLTGRVGRYSLGVLNIQSGDDELARARGTNFSVVRLKRDVLRRSSIGLMATARHEAGAGGADNVAYGVDGTFGFFANLAVNTYWARSKSTGVTRDDTSYRAQLDYAGDRYGVQLEHLAIGDHFNPGVGFVRRDDMRRSHAQVRFSPRPRESRLIRRWFYAGSVTYVENGAGVVETRERDGEFAIEFQNADRFRVNYNGTYEFLPAPFRIAPGVTLPVGGYDFDALSVGFNRAPRHRMSANLGVEYGTFYNGHRTTVSVASGRATFTSRLSAEPTYAVNWVDLAQGSFTTHLPGTRVTWTITPRMFTSALVQYNSSTQSVSANVRLRWEYLPGSELFVVFNEDRDTRARRFPDLANRAIIVKVNRLFRF